MAIDLSYFGTALASNYTLFETLFFISLCAGLAFAIGDNLREQGIIFALQTLFFYMGGVFYWSIYSYTSLLSIITIVALIIGILLAMRVNTISGMVNATTNFGDNFRSGESKELRRAARTARIEALKDRAADALKHSGDYTRSEEKALYKEGITNVTRKQKVLTEVRKGGDGTISYKYDLQFAPSRTKYAQEMVDKSMRKQGLNERLRKAFYNGEQVKNYMGKELTGAYKIMVQKSKDRTMREKKEKARRNIFERY